MSGASRTAAESVAAGLGMTHAGEDNLWVVKVPRFLMDHLQARAGSGQSLGNVTEEPLPSGAAAPPGAPSSSSSFKLTLSEEGRPETMPREYEFRFSAPPPATYVVSRSDGPKDNMVSGAKHEGRVGARCELRPHEMSSEYRQLLKERGDRADVPRRAMGIVVDDKALKRERLNHMVVRAQERAGREKKAAARERNSQLKRSRPQLSTRELKDALKACFARQSHWSRRDLVSELGNADALGSCLEALCVKITKKGNHYGDYALKDSLRAAAPPPSGAPGSSSGSGSLPVP